MCIRLQIKESTLEGFQNLKHRAPCEITLKQGFHQGYSTVWWILAMGLADLLGIADLHCQKVKSTKWLKHKLRATIGGQQFEQTDGRSGFPFSLRSVGGRLEFVTWILGGSLKLSSSGLAISMTNLLVQNLQLSFIQKLFLLAQGSVLVLQGVSH